MDRMRSNTANSCPLTPLGFLERTATVYGDCPSVIYHRTVFTWSQTRRRCLRLASSLSFLCISRGDVVSVLSPNVPAMYEMHFGVPMSGAVLNTINIRLDARTISVLLRHSGSKLVFVDPLSLPLLCDALRLLPDSHQPPRVVPDVTIHAIKKESSMGRRPLASDIFPTAQPRPPAMALASNIFPTAQPWPPAMASASDIPLMAQPRPPTTA